MKRNVVSLTMAAAMLTGMLGSVPAMASDLPEKVGEERSPQHRICMQTPI